MLVLKGIKCCRPTDHTLLNTNSIVNIRGAVQAWLKFNMHSESGIELTIVKFEVSSNEP